MTRIFFPRSAARFVRAAVLILTLGGLAGGSGCTALRQFAALRQVQFTFDHLSDVRLAGVPTSGKDSYSDLRIADVARIAAALATHDVPLEFIVHVRAENPSSNSVAARLLELDWTLFLDEGRIMNGDLEQGYSFLPGKPVDVPVTVSFDAYDMYERSAEDLFELALAIAGVQGYETDVRLDLEPTVETELGPIRYPAPISVRREVGSATR